MLNFDEHIKLNESNYELNRKINLLESVLKLGWGNSIRNLNAGEFPYWSRFFMYELKLGMDFISSLRNVFEIKSKLSSNRVSANDLWKYQVGRDPKREAENDLKRRINILDRNTLRYKEKLQKWLDQNKNTEV